MITTVTRVPEKIFNELYNDSNWTHIEIQRLDEELGRMEGHQSKGTMHEITFAGCLVIARYIQFLEKRGK